MPSPFPGMNPYIEQPAVWQDFHARFMTLAAERIGDQVEPRYYVKIEEHIFIHELSADERRPFGRPDLSVHPFDSSAPVASGEAAVAVAPATVTMPTAVDEVAQRFLEIRDRQTRQVVTVVELLSPANKDRNSGREQYWNKARLLVTATQTGFVEIDLLRGGHRIPWAGLPTCDYYALVSRSADRALDPARADVWPVRLRDPLPTIPIPLLPGEPEPTLDLQSLVHRIYDSGRYRMFIYDTPPEPLLSPAEAAWAVQLLHPEPGSSTSA